MLICLDILFMETPPKIIDSVKLLLKHLQEDNPFHEVVGQLTVICEKKECCKTTSTDESIACCESNPTGDSTPPGESKLCVTTFTSDSPPQGESTPCATTCGESQIVSDYKVVAFGDDDKVAYRTFHPYVFHTHPLGEIFTKEPPSGEDFLQALSWGYPDINDKMESSTWELVVTSEGFYWYRASIALKTFYFSLQASNSLEEQHCLAKYMLLYLNISVVLLKNDIIPLDLFLKIVRTINGPWMSHFLQSNEELLRYLGNEFPLHSIGKLIDSGLSRYVHSGFDITFEEW